MKRALTVLLAALLLLSGTALAVVDSDALYEGRWEDSVSQRAWLRIDHNWNDDYDVRVFWGSGLYEGTEWYMTGRFDPETLSLLYDNGSCYTCTYDGNGNVTGVTTNYEGKTGIIFLDSSGNLLFLTSDNSLTGCKFVCAGE